MGWASVIDMCHIRMTGSNPTFKDRKEAEAYFKSIHPVGHPNMVYRF